MCSIAGIIGGNKAEVNNMLESIKHRAPDDQGIYFDENICLGMGRLKIIDLKSQNLCPFENEHIVLSYNGEIYNYKFLRKELIKFGYKFKTNSDTEVLANAWLKWRTKIFEKLDGMYAFAIYEKKNKKLFLARDIPGEKPLYYYQLGNKFYFASEAKALKKSFTFKKKAKSIF